MRLVGFNFNKIDIEKKLDNKENIKINTNIHISNISSIKSNFFNPNNTLLGIKFNYKIDYSPDIASIFFEGNVLLSIEEKEAKDILKEWKNKKLKGNFKEVLFNIIFRKCNIRAFQLEDEFNLPIHLQLPILKDQKENQ
jgi:hypothetical protein